MKKFFLFLAVAALVVSSCGAASRTLRHDDRLTGSGNLVTRTMDAPSFHGVKTNRGITVVLSETASDKITIEADDNLMDYVIVETEGGVLVATIEPSLRSLSNAHVTVTVPARENLRSLAASSGAKIAGSTTLVADRMEIKASSGAEIDVSVQASSCDVAASSGAEIDLDLTVQQCSVKSNSGADLTVKGSAAACIVAVSSGATVSAGDFFCTDCTVETSSAGKATVNCTGVFRAEASSGSSIRNTAKSAENHISKSSGGTVRISE